MKQLGSLFTILLIIGLGSPVQARMVQGMDPYGKTERAEKAVSHKSKPPADSLMGKWESLKRRAKSEARNLWQRWAPKSQEQIEREKRVAAEVERQKQKKEKLNELKASLPVYKSKEVKGYGEYIEKAQTNLTSQPIFSTEKGTLGTSDLPKTKAGVPTFSMTQKKEVSSKSGKKRYIDVPVDDIPWLDIGIESRISSNEFLVDNYAMKLEQFNMAKPLKSPKKVDAQKLQAALDKKIVPASEQVTLARKDFGLAEIVTQKKVDAVHPMMANTNDDYKPFHQHSKSELKMLTALLLNADGKKCHLVAGLFDDLSKEKEYQREANYHLGVCSVNMGFHTEAVGRLLPLVKAEDINYAQRALDKLASNLPAEYEVKFSKVVRNLKDKTLIEKGDAGHIYYLVAKGAYKEDKYSLAHRLGLLVNEGHKDYPSAQFLVAISDYNSKKLSTAVSRLHDLRDYLQTKAIEDTNLKTLININLARIYFQSKKYRKSLEYYALIDKNHPLWVQALIEQGWAQTLTGDYAGAIGNMYSLHSPYFSAVYMPESWVVRTIGYINICQYGDAYNSLTTLEKKYRDWQDRVQMFRRKKNQAKDYYFTVINYLKGNSKKDVNGLPYQVIRELARRRAFLNVQGSINGKVDETAQYDFIYQLINKDKAQLKSRITKASQRLAKTRMDIAKANKNKDLMKFLTEWKKQAAFEKQLMTKLNFQLAAYEVGRKSYQDLRRKSKKTLNREIYALREKAGKELVRTLAVLDKEIGGVLENNEFLRYEVFSGSGENIRFQVAGGVAGRVKADVAPPKSLNWDFQGEYWQDEIGSYRSTLKNNCSQSNAAFQGGQ